MTYNGSTTVPVNAGNDTVIASVEDPNYGGLSAGTLAISQAAPGLSWAQPADIVAGQALTAAQLDATTAVPGTFTYTPALGAVLAPGVQTLLVQFTPADTLDYTAASLIVTLNVRDAGPVLASPPTASPNPTTIGVAVTFNASASNALAYTWQFGDGRASHGCQRHPHLQFAGPVHGDRDHRDGQGVTVSASVIVTVGSVPTVPGATDSDGDGFTDALGDRRRHLSHQRRRHATGRRTGAQPAAAAQHRTAH